MPSLASRRNLCASAAVLLLVTMADVAFAQEGPVAPGAVSLSAPPPTTLNPAPVSAPPLSVPEAKEAPEKPAVSDHEQFVHHVAFGYFGISQLPVGSGGGAAGIVNAPVIGIRYWASRMVGIDAGIGFGYSTSTPAGAGAASTDSWGFAFHAGVPLSLASSKHFSFEVVPLEATIGFTGGSIPEGGGLGAMSTSVNGFRVDVGARVGAELQFGFIGVPQLAIEASLGLYLQHEAYGASGTPDATTTTFATSVGSDPWAIFTDTISALYYF
jgi:hypothetical protein